MGKVKRKYKNRYWIKNDNSIYELHFTEFFEDEIVLKFKRVKANSKNYIYVSSILNVEYEYIKADSVEDAMEQFEDMITNHITEQIIYYEKMLDEFNGGCDSNED